MPEENWKEIFLQRQPTLPLFKKWIELDPVVSWDEFSIPLRWTLHRTFVRNLEAIVFILEELELDVDELQKTGKVVVDKSQKEIVNQLKQRVNKTLRDTLKAVGYLKFERKYKEYYKEYACQKKEETKPPRRLEVIKPVKRRTRTKVV